MIEQGLLSVPSAIAAILFAAAALSVLRTGRRVRTWASKKTLQVCHWIPEIDNVIRQSKSGPQRRRRPPRMTRRTPRMGHQSRGCQRPGPAWSPTNGASSSSPPASTITPQQLRPARRGIQRQAATTRGSRAAQRSERAYQVLVAHWQQKPARSRGSG